MNGAKEFYNIIETANRLKIGQLVPVQECTNGGDSRCYKHGKVIFRTSSHARGKNFNIFLVDGIEKLEVYGVTGGQIGWTETYGWIKKGTWVKPILEYMQDLDRQITVAQEEMVQRTKEKLRVENSVVGESVDHFNKLFQAQ